MFFVVVWVAGYAQDNVRAKRWDFWHPKIVGGGSLFAGEFEGSGIPLLGWFKRKPKRTPSIWGGSVPEKMKRNTHLPVSTTLET